MDFSLWLISLVASAALCLSGYIAKYYLYPIKLSVTERVSLAKTLALVPDTKLAAALEKGALTLHQRRMILLNAARGRRVD
jgi:hypothetical protein